MTDLLKLDVSMSFVAVSSASRSFTSERQLLSRHEYSRVKWSHTNDD